MLDTSTVDAALDTLRPSLGADGFELRAGTIGLDRIEIILSATGEACIDCLVPDPLMIQMIGDAIESQDAASGEVPDIELIKEGFDRFAVN